MTLKSSARAMFTTADMTASLTEPRLAPETKERSILTISRGNYSSWHSTA